jgi:hypothetical protein
MYFAKLGLDFSVVIIQLVFFSRMPMFGEAVFFNFRFRLSNSFMPCMDVGDVSVK